MRLPHWWQQSIDAELPGLLHHVHYESSAKEDLAALGEGRGEGGASLRVSACCLIVHLAQCVLQVRFQLSFAYIFGAEMFNFFKTY